MEKREKQQSELITAVKFPLIILVVLIHSGPAVENGYAVLFLGKDLFGPLYTVISQNIATIAVPCFFLISGFLFFKSSEDFTKELYVEKILKRVRTLVIPYLIWNGMYIAAVFLKNYVFQLAGRPHDAMFLNLAAFSLPEMFWTRQFPINYPLWYLRDLICMVILSPVIFLYFRYLKFWGFIILLALNLFNIQTGVPGLSLTAFTYFGLGAYLAIHQKNIITEFLALKYPCLIAALLFGTLAAFHFDSSYFKALNSLYIISGVVTFFNVVYYMIQNEKVKAWLFWLSTPVFFIFCAHGIYIIEILRGYFSRQSLAYTDLGLIVSYFLITIITLIVCIVAYHVLFRLMPGVMNVLLGGRQQSRNLRRAEA